MGVSVLCVANGDERLARAAAEEIAGIALARRERNSIRRSPPWPRQSKKRVRRRSARSASSIAGTTSRQEPGDSTVLFHAIDAAGLAPFCGILYDPHAADRCREAGIGEAVDLMVGGRRSGAAAAPFHLTGIVRFLHDGKFIEMEPRHGGHRFLDQGDTAAVKREDGSIVVVNSLRIMPTSLAQLTSLGIEPQKLRAIIVKGATAPIAAYGPLGEVIQVDSEGVTRAGPEHVLYASDPSRSSPWTASSRPVVGTSISLERLCLTSALARGCPAALRALQYPAPRGGSVPDRGAVHGQMRGVQQPDTIARGHEQGSV